MQKNELAEKTKSSVEDSSIPLWFPNLTPHLAEIGWQALKTEFGITASNYGTARIFLGKIDTSLSVFSCKDKFGNIPFHIELLPKELTENYADSQIEFYNSEEITKLSVLDCIAEAIDLIKLVPSLSESIFMLVKSVHLIKLEDDNYDVSFSEPTIPFSIFISIPKNRIKADSLRVAEAIVHEAMHLQLSLIEKVIPLVKSNEQKFYSPWKDEYRTADGVLHALYVFQVLNFFFRELLNCDSLSLADKNYLIERSVLIVQQVSEVQNFANSSDLTQLGKRFTHRLLAKPKIINT